jgi:hypothetical protein
MVQMPGQSVNKSTITRGKYSGQLITIKSCSHARASANEA